ncbi:VWA domain-containing protein, partial [Pseudaeromonas pectinilytica]
TSLGESFSVVLVDDDNTSLTQSLDVTVADDAPVLTSVESAALLNSDAGFASGSSVLNLGADQPAIGDLTGNIPGWDGTSVTYAQSSLTSNEKPVYFFVDPNNPETLFAYTSETAGAYDPDSLTQSLIFTLDYQESGDYALTMDGKLDAPTQEFGASFSTTIGGNQDYLVVTNTGGIYKPGATIPDGQTVVMMIDSAPGVTVNSSQQGLGADGQWIEGDAVINFNFTTPVVSAEFKIDIQSVNEGADTTNDVDWVVHGTDANGNLVTESGTTPFTDGVMTQIPTTLTHITKVELSDHSDLDGSSFRVSGYEVVDRVDEEPFDKSFVVGVTDADGDTANGQLTVTFNPDGDTQLLVGSNANDVAGSSARFITTADAGAIATGSGDDILVGDEGRSSLVGKSVNLILMLDTSGSMDSKISFDGGHNNTTRLEAMQDAVNNLLANLAGGAADHVRVHIIDFDSTATSLGSFDVKDGELTAAEQAVNQLKEGGITNYEAALQAALNWLGSSGSDAPLTGANVINQAIFISDGQPNSWLIGNSSDLANYKHPDGSEAEALKQILGLSGSDSVNEVALLEQLFAQIQAIGINVSANDLNVLNRVEGELANVSPDAATNITTAQQLDDVLANLDPSLVLRDAGNDQLSGDGGNDLLFGDAPFTDTLAHNAGLMLAAGAGWQVFSELEAGQSTVDGYDHWTRADTVAYIQNHAEELAQESGRNLGNDILDGGAGNDYLFGQEGDDQLDGGVGNDQLYGGSGSDEMTGGNGNDVFVWLKGDADKSTDTITDFTIGHDKLDLADVLNDPTGNLSNYLSVTGSGDDALVKVYSAGNASGGGTANLTIVLDGLASTSTELQQLQDYLLNQDGVIK